MFMNSLSEFALYIPCRSASLYLHKWMGCASQTNYLCLQITISYNCTEVWEQLGAESQWRSRGRAPGGGQGA